MIKRIVQYIVSILSPKKIFYKDVSWFSYWDGDSTFTKNTRIGPKVRLLKSHVGNYTRISKGCSVVFSKIGNFCSLASDVQVGAGRHPLNYASTSQIFYNPNTLNDKWVKPIKYPQNLPINIGSDVWLGTNCFIMGGVTIGHGAVVAAKAVVTKDIPPYAIVGGIPAKLIKYRFSPEVIERLLEIEWWNLDDNQITEKIGFFRESEITLQVLDIYFPKKS